MLVLASLMTSTYFESMVKVVSCRTYNVDRCASPLMLQKSLPFSSSNRVSHSSFSSGSGFLLAGTSPRVG